MYGQDMEFAAVVLMIWMGFLLVTALVEAVIGIKGAAPKGYYRR